MNKRCDKCGLTKPIEEFRLYGRVRNARCKHCTRPKVLAPEVIEALREQERREWVRRGGQ